MTTLPEEVVRRLGITAAERIGWIEDGLGRVRVVPHSDDLELALAAHDDVLSAYASVFRKLAD